MRAIDRAGERGTTPRSLATAVLLLLLAASATRLGAQQQRVQVKAGGWVQTSIVLNPGDHVVVMGAGGQVSCAQCNPPVTSGPGGLSGYYKLVALVGQTQYDLAANRDIVVSQGGTLYLAVGNVPQNQGGYWTGAYDVQVIRYPGAGTPGTPPPAPMPQPPTYPLIAWEGSDCQKLATDGILEGQLQFPGGGVGVLCHIYVEDWEVNGDPVWVCLPGATPGDNWVGHPSGITVFGSGFVNSWQLSGYSSSWPEAQPRHVGHQVFPWTLSFAARPRAVSATIPVQVFQGKSCSQATSQVWTFNVPVVVRPAARGTVVNLASVFWVGYQTASAVTSATNNWDATLTRNALVAAQQSAAASSGYLLPQAWGDLANRVAQGGNAAVLEPVKQLHAQVSNGLAHTCTCGNVSTNMAYAYSLGYNMCLAEIATLNGWDVRLLAGYLNLLKQQAPPSGLLGTRDIDQALAYLGQGYDSRSLKDYVAGMRANMAQAVTLNCTCM